jgi:hypothetical protein
MGVRKKLRAGLSRVFAKSPLVLDTKCFSLLLVSYAAGADEELNFNLSVVVERFVQVRDHHHDHVAMGRPPLPVSALCGMALLKIQLGNYLRPRRVSLKGGKATP